MFRLSQLCTPPSTQTPPAFKRRSACAARSNVLERSAAQHGAGKALRHQRRGCAVLRRSAAGALGTSDRASRAAVQVPLGRLALASFGTPFFFDLLCGRSCESTPKPSRQWRREWRRAGRSGCWARSPISRRSPRRSSAPSPSSGTAASSSPSSTASSTGSSATGARRRSTRASTARTRSSRCAP